MESLWNAVHLLVRTDQTYEYELYQRDGFYIELKRQIEFDVLHGVRTFKSAEPLDAYL